MFDSIISFSIRNKLIVGLLALCLVAWGIYSLNKLPIDAVPDITNNQVLVITNSPTLATQEVERFITYPLEMAISTIPNLVEVRSISRFGLSVITVVFKDNVDVYLARQLVSERIQDAQSQIPDGLGKPEMAPVTTGLGEIYQYVLHTKPGYENRYSAMDLRTMQDWIVKRQLIGTPGVAEVSSWGGFLKQYEISLNPERLHSMDVTATDIFNSLEQNNENTGGSYIEKGSNAYFIRGLGLISDIPSIEKIVVKNTNGVPVTIRDVASVGFGGAIRYGAVTRNGQGEVTGGVVLMLKGQNASEVIDRVKDKIAVIQRSLPDGVVIEPFIDRSQLVGRAIHTVRRNLIEGGLIVIFILVIFLGNLRAGLVVASVIPLAMLFAISMMNLFGVSGNLMSLGAIDFGLIVDGAVIIVESIVHRISTNKQLNQEGLLSQGQMDEQVYQAASQIRHSAAFGEIIILIVYLPILTLVGIEGKMFRPMAETVGFAILGAFILSLTYVPMMSALFLSRRNSHKRTVADSIMDAVHKVYDPLIAFALSRKKIIITGALILLGASLLLFSRMGGEFIPTLEEGDFAIETRLMSGTSLSQTIKTTTEAEKILLRQFPEVKQVVSRIGTSEIPTDPMSIETADIMVALKDKSEWESASSREELAEKMSKALSVLPGVSFEFSQPIQMRFNELMTGVKQDIALKIYGENMEELSQLANNAAKLIAPIQGVEAPVIERTTGLPQITVAYNRDKLARYGITVADANKIIKTAFAGEPAGVVFEDERRFDIVVRLDRPFRQDLQDVKNLYIGLPSGKQVPLEELADISYKEGAAQISRDEAKRRVTIGINAHGRDVESIIKDIKQTLDAKLHLPAGYYITYGGQFENLVAAKQRLSIAVPVAMLLILLLLYFTFHSVGQALLIFTAVPFSAIGGIIALYLRGMPFSISAGVGFIALFGVAVLNGIVLIGYFNQLRDEGETDIGKRILIGTRVRLRPVIMTAAVASLGFLPMALSTSAGAEVQKPLATVVIGGLTTATLLTLLVLPVLYMLFAKRSKGSPNNIKPAINTALVVLAFGLCSLNVSAQDTTHLRLSLDGAIQYALAHNAGVRSASYAVDLQKSLKRTAYDLPKTNINYMQGQINSYYQDNNITLSQEFAFPSVYKRQAGVSRELVRAEQQKLVISRAELAGAVKAAYYDLLYAKSKLALSKTQDSIYSDFENAAAMRYKTGATGYLEKATASTRLLEIKVSASQAQGDINIYYRQLQGLLNTDKELELTDNQLPKRELKITGDSFSLVQNPLLTYFRQQVNLSQRQTELERAKLLPDFHVGYFNQSINGIQNINGKERTFTPSDRFTGFQLGIAIPVWFIPQRARVKASELSEQISRNNFDYQKTNLEVQADILFQQYLKLKNSLALYESSALGEALLIRRNAGLSYKAGDISYVEFVQNLDHALRIQYDYLETLSQYNQIIIQIEALTGIQ